MNHYDLLIYRSTHQSLFVKDQSFSFTQLVVATYKIKWRGKNAPTFSTSDTLPTGITLSSDGIVSYDGSIIQSGVTNWTVTATDGVDTVTANMTTTMNSATVEIVDGQTISFQIGVASSMQIEYTADGTPTFAVTSGTLPSGVTMTTGGLLEYDGTGSADVSTSVEVTATLATSASDTATIGVKLASIPQDYVFYAPFLSDYADHSTYNRTMSYRNYEPTAYSTVEGIPCATVPARGVFYTTDTTGLELGQHDRTYTCWFKVSDTAGSWNTPISYGYPSSYQAFQLVYVNRQMLGCMWGYDPNPRFNLDTKWHCYVTVYTAATRTFDFYADGTLIASNSSGSALNLPSNSGIGIGGHFNGNDPVSHEYNIAGVRIYDRTLTAQEIQSISTEFEPLEEIVFNNQHATFITETSATKQLVATPTGCTFSTSDTLPNGVTLASDGTLSFDGSVISQDSTTVVSVTASKSGHMSATASVTLKMLAEEPSIPSDYIWYTPFTTDYTEETSGIVGVAGQPNAFSIATDDSKFGTGYLAARKTNSDTVGIEYANTATYMDLSAGTITISLWLRAPNWAQYSQLLGGTRPGDGSAGFVLFEDFSSNPRIDFRSATNTSRGSSNVNVDSEWHHWLFTRTAQGAWTWYKDGVVATSGTGDTGSINGTQQNMKIGGGTNWGKQAYFDLAHFRVYDRVLDATEIDELYHEFDATPSSNLVIEAELATDTTTTVGTFVSKPSSFSFSSVDGVNALYGDGTGNTGLMFTPSESIAGAQPRTFSVWMNPSGYPHDANAIYGHGSNSTYDICQLEAGQSHMHMPWGEAYDSPIRQVSLPQTGQWTHAVMVYDGTNVKLYFNGTLEATTNSVTFATSNTDVILGNRSGGGWSCAWYGYLRKFKVWDKALTAQEVSDLYDTELPTFDPVPVVPTDYHERWALQSDRNSTKYPSDTNHTLNRSTNASVSYGASGGMTGATVSSGCLYNTNSISGSVSNGYCLSLWCKCSSTPTSSTNIKCFANPANSTQYGLWLGYRQNKYAVGCDMATSSLRAVSDVSVDTSWHNLVANYDKTNLKVDLWIDGVKATTLSLSSAISKSAGIVVNAGNVSDVTAPDYMPDVSVKYAYVTTFTRTLSDAEVLGLYHEFD